MIELMTEDQLKTRREQRDRCEEDPCGSFECEFCNQDEDRPRPVKYVPGDVRFVNVHMVHRCYGGPEEGGWWWNRRECVSSIPLQHPGDVDEINSVLKFLAGRYENVGDIYSMVGGVQYAIDFDAEHCQHEVLTSGGYC